MATRELLATNELKKKAFTQLEKINHQKKFIDTFPCNISGLADAILQFNRDKKITHFPPSTDTISNAFKRSKLATDDTMKLIWHFAFGDFNEDDFAKGENKYYKRYACNKTAIQIESEKNTIKMLSGTYEAYYLDSFEYIHIEKAIIIIEENGSVSVKTVNSTYTGEAKMVDNNQIMTITTTQANANDYFGINICKINGTASRVRHLFSIYVGKNQSHNLVAIREILIRVSNNVSSNEPEIIPTNSQYSDYYKYVNLNDKYPNLANLLTGGTENILKVSQTPNQQPYEKIFDYAQLYIDAANYHLLTGNVSKAQAIIMQAQKDGYFEVFDKINHKIPKVESAARTS